jgi:hypothetical protein
LIIIVFILLFYILRRRKKERSQGVGWMLVLENLKFGTLFWAERWGKWAWLGIKISCFLSTLGVVGRRGERGDG